VEDRGYPQDFEGKLGRIKMLLDTNGDGRPDRTTIFADQLEMPTGVMRWKKGILVTAAPDIWYFEDTNQDGRADIRKKILTGFAVSNPQHTVNGPVYGLDNWVYVAHKSMIAPQSYRDKHGGEEIGGDIRFADKAGIPPLTKQGRNLRIRPDAHRIEALAGYSQFGHAFDDWGRHFATDNAIHIRHEAIRAEYLDRNPDLPLETAMEDISDHGNSTDVFPVTENPEIAHVTGFGKSTSTCGITLILSDVFPADTYGNALIAEPVHNVVLRDVLVPAGSTFIAKRARAKVEFLASKDSWFRPVNMYIGPDGAIYLVDFYRPVLEHPEWVPNYSSHLNNPYRGNDRGRVYRIIPGTGLPLPKKIQLSKASTHELVKHLASANVWWRRTAQRLLVDRNSPETAAELVRLYEETPSPLGKLHALWTLEGLGKLDSSLIEKALAHSEAGLRENAIRLAEPRLANEPQLTQKLILMTNDTDARVRFQLLCTLGNIRSEETRRATNDLLLRGLEDRWVQAAALSASSGNAIRLFALATSGPGKLVQTETKGRANLIRQVTAVIGRRQKESEVRWVLRTVAQETAKSSGWWRTVSLEGLADGMQASNAVRTGDTRRLLLQLFESSQPSIRRASLRLLELVGLPANAGGLAIVRQAASIAEHEETSPDHRVDAIGLLALDGTEWNGTPVC